MTTADWVKSITNLALTIMLLIWVFAVFRRDRLLKKQQEAEEKVLETMELGVEGLKQACLAALWLRHARYHSDDEEPPLTVKCLDCGETCGTVDRVEDIITVAGDHVMSKFEGIVRDVQTAEAANK